MKSKYTYDTFYATDMGSEEFLINLDKTTISITIDSGLPKEYFTSETEKLVFNFNEYMKNKIEKMYQNWIEN